MQYRNVSDEDVLDVPIGYTFTPVREDGNVIVFRDAGDTLRTRYKAAYEEVFEAPVAPPTPAPYAVPAEVDPTGRDAHAPGAKLDAGKAAYDMALFSFPLAIAAVNAVGEFGAKKYSPGGFLHVPNGQKRYLNADLRHKSKTLQGEEVDPETGELHDAHSAWCALAKLELKLRGKE
jgi:hypothetical protein